MKFRIRILKPRITEWEEVEGKDLIDAVQAYHFEFLGRLPHVALRGEGEDECFSLFDTPDGELISRICYSPLRRAGGVRQTGTVLTRDEAAALLG